MTKKVSKGKFDLSVHDLVDFLLRAGDIDNRVYNAETMAEGTKIHAEFQKNQEGTYLAEYPLKGTVTVDGWDFNLQGRADGIYKKGGLWVVDEIKSTIMPLERFFRQQNRWHLGQAEVYALLFARERKLDEIGVRLTYISQGDHEERDTHEYRYSTMELEQKISDYCAEYLEFQKVHFEHIKNRDKSAKIAVFPYEYIRAGQQQMMDLVAKKIDEKGIAMIEAPTGIGKTMSSLYPAIRSFKQGKVDKVFYLTAKGTGKASAHDAMGELIQSGLTARDSVLLAKRKICFCPGKECNPDQCPFAKGYYDKIKGVLKESMESGERFDEDFVRKTARENAMCPFELQLDLSLFSDVIICDFNYFFDPLVYLERYFGPMSDPSTCVVLCDEAHNLVDRGRSMYSSVLKENELDAAIESLDGMKCKAVKNALEGIKTCFTDLSASMVDGYAIMYTMCEPLIRFLDALKRNHQLTSKKKMVGWPDAYLNFFMEANRFSMIFKEHYGGNYRFYLSREKDVNCINLFCLDPSEALNAQAKRVRSAVFYSATLSPITYYQDAILGNHDQETLVLPSPFDKSNLSLLIAPKVSVRYKDRETSYAEVATYLKRLVDSKMGNYFIYFPSYEYMYRIAPYLDFGDAEMLMQNRDMTEDDKAEFLSNFVTEPKFTTVGLLVLGGAFSEGIDLVSDRLIGVAIVGIGFPALSHENDLIREYMDQVNGHGFSFAYIDPGINKVMQAVGRLIRSESDKGAALLIDDRYLRSDYRDLFQHSYKDYEVVTSPSDVSSILRSFYKK